MYWNLEVIWMTERRWSIVGRTVDLEILLAVSAIFGNLYAVYDYMSWLQNIFKTKNGNKDCKILSQWWIANYLFNYRISIQGYCYPVDVWNRPWVICLVFFVVSSDTVSWGKAHHWKTFLSYIDTFQPGPGWYYVTIVE